MPTMKDSQEDFVVDTSLSILFEPANSRSSCKAKDAQVSTNNAENNDDVEKLVRLLNNYANWELRTLLVGILKDKKVSALQDRLLGNNPGETSDEEQSSGSEKSSSYPVAGLVDSKSNSHSGNHDSEPDLVAEHGQKPHDHRGSGSGTRRSARTGRLTRSLSSERKLDAARRPARESAISARQASILAKRRELDRQRQESSGADCDESPKEDELVASSDHTKPARRNRSLSPAHNIRRSLYETKSLGREHKSGSADNLLGLASHSFHAPGARRGNTRNNRNASFKLVAVPSAHGSGVTERNGTSRGHSPTPTSRITRRHSKEQVEVRSSPSSGRRRLLASTKASNHHRESNTPPPVPHHRESHTPPSNHHKESNTPMPSNMNRPRESNAPASLSPPSAPTGSDGKQHSDSAFLQFTVNPISHHEKLTFFATSSRALTNANDIVEELRSSTHDPINIVVGQPTEPPMSGVNPTTGSSAEKLAKRGFDLLLRRKRSQLEKLKDKSGNDHGALLAHGDSDEESFG